MTELSWALLSTPVGLVSVGCSPAGVASVRYAPRRAARSQGERRQGERGQAEEADPAARALACAARQELTEYFCGERRAFDVAVDWTAVAGLQRTVLGVLASSVSYGHTISYGALARAAGLTDADPAESRIDQHGKPPAGLAARTVGAIMSQNPIPVIVPCHRVVASDGLGGYSGGTGIEVKRWLLILEGALPPTLDWQPMARPD
jgi:methylated-DNA-[protein]-cysteine S-methyltransferase